jgi:hypothetical protein
MLTKIKPMKNSIQFLFTLVIIISIQSCGSRGGKKQPEVNPADTQSVADTGYTGIKQYYSKSTLTYEATFRNGVREGLMRSFYPDGKVRQTFWYRNGMKEDTAIWFYEEGPIFRKTPFRRDSMNGIQSQYYKSGALRAKMNFVNGLRTPYLEEFTSDGKKIKDYPLVVITIKDDYMKNGNYSIYLALDKKNIKANFYRGEFTEEGLFAPKGLQKLNNSETTGYLQLKKNSSPGQGWVGIISEISTTLGNRQIVYNKLVLPYNDLK